MLSKELKTKPKNKKGVPQYFIGTLGTSLLWNILTAKGTIRAGEATIMLPHLLTNVEIQKYYQNDPKVTGVYSRNN